MSMAAARRDLAIALAMLTVIVGLLVVGGDSAAGDVGVEKASRHAGRAGQEVRLTLGCGFCFPPCKGPKGQRHPEGFEKGPCMLGTHTEPPASFGISLLPKERAEALLRCQMRKRSCPSPTRPPRRGHYRFLGEAVPPPGGNNPEHGDPPRYLLSFQIPRLPAGEYSYVIWCDVCLGGKAGWLITDPASPLWRLEISAARSRPSAPGRMAVWPERFASTNTAASTSSR
jgi:hypothetical protein